MSFTRKSSGTLLALALVVVLALSPVSNGSELKPAGTKFPFTSVVQVKATFPNKSSKSGSGVLVGPYHVLTCAHAVYDVAQGGFASQVDVIPMAKGSDKPFGVASVKVKRVFKEWAEYNKKNPGNKTNGDAHDISLLTLDQNIGERARWLAYASANDEAFAKGTVFNMAGYPFENDYDGQRMYTSFGPIEGLATGGRSFSYKPASIMNISGMSGGPVWIYEPKTQRRVVYGINIGKYGDGSGFATRITPTIFKTLEKWQASDPAPDAGPASNGSKKAASSTSGEYMRPAILHPLLRPVVGQELNILSMGMLAQRQDF